MKRKASVLDEPAHVNDWLQSDSSVTTASPESTHTTHNRWHISPVPYLSSRTRKRYRDGRPDDEAIHNSTLSRLFEAQRKIHSGELAERRRSQQVGSYLMSLDTFEPMAVEHPNTEPKQQSIDAFFGNTQNDQRQRNPSRLVPSIQISHADVGVCCEDCASQLGPTSSTDMDMDMDIEMQMMDWSCASCSRNVCDMCAVRGNQRICLECALPGGGQ